MSLPRAIGTDLIMLLTPVGDAYDAAELGSGLVDAAKEAGDALTDTLMSVEDSTGQTLKDVSSDQSFWN